MILSFVICNNNVKNKSNLYVFFTNLLRDIQTIRVLELKESIIVLYMQYEWETNLRLYGNAI